MPVNESQLVAQYPRGMNGSISYALNGRGSMIYVRIRKIAYSWEVIATESHAVRTRAMYPHQRAISRFGITLELNGYNDYRRFMNFMRSYIDVMFGADKKSMFIMSAVRGFNRWGIPIKGIADGDHTGSNVFSPTLVFESINDPLDPTVYTPEGGNISRANMNGVDGDAATFFFPFSEASRDASARPETYYDFDPSDGLTSVRPGRGLFGPGSLIGDLIEDLGGANQQDQDALDDLRRNGQL